MESLKLACFLFTTLPLFADSQLSTFHQLHEIDSEISSLLEKLIDAVIHQDAGIEEVEKAFLKNIDIGGSAIEGAMVSHIFKPNVGKDNGELSKEIETEFEYNLLEIPLTYKHYIEDIPGKEGFVRVLMNNDILQLALKKGFPKEYAEIFAEAIGNGVLKPYYLKERVLKKADVRKHDNKIKLLLAAALGVDIEIISLSHHLQDINESSEASYMSIFLDKKLEVKLLWDIACKVKIDWWPSVATEWISRQRNWPIEHTISGLTSYSYIVTKPMSQNLINEDSSELRYSFAHIEKSLISARSTHQNLIYLVFKSMFYKWIKPINPEQIQSSIAKNVMFWACEKYPPQHDMWSQTATASALSYLFGEMRKGIKENNLPHYFIPKINMIGKMSENDRVMITRQIDDILNDLDRYIPTNVEDVTKRCRKMLQTLKSSFKIMDDLRQNNYHVFLKRPDLLPAAMKIYGSHLAGGNLDDYVENAKEKLNEFAENFNLGDVEKKVKKFLEKFEL